MNSKTETMKKLTCPLCGETFTEKEIGAIKEHDAVTEGFIGIFKCENCDFKLESELGWSKENYRKARRHIKKFGHSVKRDSEYRNITIHIQGKRGYISTARMQLNGHLHGYHDLYLHGKRYEKIIKDAIEKEREIVE